MSIQFSGEAFVSRRSSVVARWYDNITIENSEFVVGKTQYKCNIRVTVSGGAGGYIDRDLIINTDGNTIPAINLYGAKTFTDLEQNNIDQCIFEISPDSGLTDSLVMHIVTDSHILSTSVVDNHNDFYPTYSTVWGNGQPLLSGMCIRTYYGNIGDITISADFPIFIDNTQLYSYDTEMSASSYYVVHHARIPRFLYTGESMQYLTEIASGNYANVNKAVNYYSIANTIPQDKTYFIRSSLKVNGTPTTHKDYCFQILPDAKICLYQDDTVTGDGSPNLHLIISQYPCLVKGYSDPDSDYTESSNPDTEYWHSGYWRDIETGVNYTGVCSTNIPIFRGQENAQKYLDGELSESDALNGGSFANTDSTIGGELTSSDIPTVNLSASGVGCYTYAVSEAELKDIMANYLFTTDANLQQSIKDALWTWGNNPIDFMIDCYYVPFSITAFYDTINANLKFGTYQFPNTSYPAVKESNGNRLTLFNTTFEGVYGDWRDYTQFTYDLYLPFVGFFTLDNYKYLNHVVRCEMMFDLSTHNVRYYLFVDGIITDRVDGSVGVNIPLMATDTVNKAKHDRETKYGLVNDSLKLAGSVGQLAAGDIGGAVSGVNTVISGIKKYEDLQTKPTSSVEGSFSSSMNIYDISYAYLRITEKQLILPDKLNQLYNYPSYYMGSASQLSGYCEISDIRLNGFTGTVEEMEELKRDLMEGVIL